MSDPVRLAQQAAWRRFRMETDPEFRARQREKSRRWKLNNPEKAAANRAAWYAKHREEIRAKAAEARRSPEHLAKVAAGRESARLLNQRRREEAIARREAIAALGREVRLRAWRVRLPGLAARKREAKRRAKHARRARRRGVDAGLSRGRVKALLVLQRGRCAACRAAGVELTLDHIVPLALGGPHTDGNVQLLCRMCNSRKSAKPPEIFMRSMGFLL